MTAIAQSEIHVRLQPPAWDQLRLRAGLVSLSPDDYVDRILSYSRDLSPTADPSVSPLAEALYVMFRIPNSTRLWLEAIGLKSSTNLAVLTGHLIEKFLERHLRDPADLELIHRLHTHLAISPFPAEADLLDWVRCAIGLPSMRRMPPAYQVRWIHSRLQPLLPAVQRPTETVALTSALVSELIHQANSQSKPA